MQWSDCDPTVLLTSDDRLPDAAFHGVAYVGADLVVGSAGAEEYWRSSGSRVPAGEDGAYASLVRVGPDSWHLATDFKGFCGVYYHHQPGYWAIANSFAALVDHLHNRGVNVEPNHSTIAAFGANQDMVRTLMSFDTCAHGISLLPSHAVLRLVPGPAADLELLPVSVERSTTTAYDSALAQFLDIWTARFLTIFNDERLRHTLHVSGGKDSRLVLAIALPAIGKLDTAAQQRIRFFSQFNRADDLRVATNVAELVGTELNAPVQGVASRRLSAGESFGRWRHSSLGCYSHLFFPQDGYNNTTNVISGVGGEAHRTVYRERIARAEIADVAAASRRRFPRRELFEQWQRSLVEADVYLARQWGAHEHALVRSHREFRDRFHSGKLGKWATSTLPLCSRYLSECSNALPVESFDDGQLLVDLMNSTTPSLLDISYDKASKATTREQRARLTSIDWAPSDTFGDVYMAPSVDGAPALPSAPWTPLAHMLDGVAGVLEKPEAVSLVGREVLEDGVSVLRRNATAAAQNLHGRGRTAHLASLVNWLFD